MPIGVYMLLGAGDSLVWTSPSSKLSETEENYLPSQSKCDKSTSLRCNIGTLIEFRGGKDDLVFRQNSIVLS